MFMRCQPCPGPITPGATAAEISKAAAEVKTPPPAFVVKLSTKALMMYLQSSIGKQLKWLYPTNPAHADKWLEQEIYRCVVCQPVVAKFNTVAACCRCSMSAGFMYSGFEYKRRSDAGTIDCQRMA